MAIDEHLAAIADHHGQAAEHVEALKAAADDGDAADDEDAPDQELFYEVARRKRAWMRGSGQIGQIGRFADPEAERRRRLVAIAKMRFGPLSSAEAAAVERARLVERMRRGP